MELPTRAIGGERRDGEAAGMDSGRRHGLVGGRPSRGARVGDRMDGTGKALLTSGIWWVNMLNF